MAACPDAPIKISTLAFDRTRAMEMHVLPVGHLASRDTIDISDIAGERYVQRSYCEFNDVVDSVLMPAASIAKPSIAAIVMIGCWPWSRAVSALAFFRNIRSRTRTSSRSR